MLDQGTSSFSSFGDLLKYLRRRAQLTQRELAIAVGYTEGHISRLEKNQRLPDLATVAALFIPALMLEEEPEDAAHLIQLAARSHGEEMQTGQSLTFSRTREIREISEREESIPSNLPIQLTTFVGRQSELQELTGLLSGRTPPRLVTLTGPGGMGKTRLALQAAIGLSRPYLDGVWFVDLTPLTTSDLIAQTIASALSIPEKGGDSVEQTILAYLRLREILIIIDNCEHMIRAVAQCVEKLLRSCAHVQILATSREPLHVPGEVNYRIPPLSVPKSEESVFRNGIGNEAVQLFMERARNIEPKFTLTEANAPSIVRICQQLDGMPLAIELAAARIQLLSLSQIEARLGDRLHLLASGQTTLQRHQTLRATIEWSHDMLSDAEKILFRRLSVFAGGWTLEAANSICRDSESDILDTLTQLVNKSLVVVERQPDTAVRYTMLETIREFAREQLRAANEMDVLRDRHFEHFLHLAKQGEAKLFAAESSVDWAETEISNLRAVLTWALERDVEGNPSEARVEHALELMIRIWPLWLARGYSIEGSDWLSQLLSVDTAATPARARALMLAGDLAGFKGDREKKTLLIEKAVELAQQTGDPQVIGMALMEMGVVRRDDHGPEGIQWLLESLTCFQALKDSLWECRVSFLLAETHVMYGNLEAAKPLLIRGMELCRAENDKWQIAWGLEGLGNVQRLEGNFEQARLLYEESLPLKVSVMDKLGIAYLLAAFAQLAAAQGQYKRAATLWGAAEQLGQTMNLVLIPEGEGSDKLAFIETRAQLGEETFENAWNHGLSMQLQEAIEYALG